MSIPEQLGDYRVIEEIGRGGFGIVYRAHQESLDRPVALKVLYRHLIHTQEQISRFEREARAAARLDHPAIVSVYAWGEANDDFYIAQRLIGSGRTLADELERYRQEGAVPKGWFRKVAKDLAHVAEGLGQAHDRGIVHRDVKPSNVLLDDDLQPSLGDFGLAKVEDGLELSRTGDFAGSPFYMSPEQADSRVGSVDHRSDVYSLGVTLYEMLTLTQPFQGTSSAEIMRKILAEDPMPPSKVESRVPRDLETICLKAMEKNPMRRYPSALEFANDLRSFLDGEPISAVPIGRTRRLVRRARRHSAVFTGVILTVLFAGALYFAISGSSEVNQQLEADKVALETKNEKLQQQLGEVAKTSIVKEAGQIIEQQKEDLEAEIQEKIAEAEKNKNPELVAELEASLQSELENLDETYELLVDQAQQAVANADPETLQNIATEVFSGGGVLGALKAAGMAVIDQTAVPVDEEVEGAVPVAAAVPPTVDVAPLDVESDEGADEDDMVLVFDGFGFRAVPRSRAEGQGGVASSVKDPGDAPPLTSPSTLEPPSAGAPGTQPSSSLPGLGFLSSLFGGDDEPEEDDDDEEPDASADDEPATDGAGDEAPESPEDI